MPQVRLILLQNCLAKWCACQLGSQLMTMLCPALMTGFTAVHRLEHVVGLAPMDFPILAAEKHNEEQKCSEHVVSYRIHMDSHV